MLPRVAVGTPSESPGIFLVSMCDCTCVKMIKTAEVSSLFPGPFVSQSCSVPIPLCPRLSESSSLCVPLYPHPFVSQFHWDLIHLCLSPTDSHTPLCPSSTEPHPFVSQYHRVPIPLHPSPTEPHPFVPLSRWAPSLCVPVPLSPIPLCPSPTEPHPFLSQSH